MALEIIGPGFGRTGTNSLKVALEHLGFGPTHHMFEVRDNPPQISSWEALARGEAVDWDVAFRGYHSQVDWPGARFWRELAAHYPKAKVILTVRDPDEWFDSVQATIMRFMAGRAEFPDAHQRAIGEMANTLINEGVFDGRLDDRKHATAVFNAHIAEVQAAFPTSRLLTYDVREGWQPLCRFLGCDIPAISFPKLNSSKQFTETEWKDETATTV
ncbi:MAG: sulfotransferase family protein [Devosia sp.]